MNDSTDGWLPSFAQVSGDITEIFEQRFPKQLETGAYGRRKNRKNQFKLIVTEKAHFLCSHALYQRIDILIALLCTFDSSFDIDIIERILIYP